MTPEHQKIVDALFNAVSEGESLYAILDSARNIDIAYRLLGSNDMKYVSLYKGRKEEPYWDAAPNVVLCERDLEFFDWVIAQGWGNAWGIFLTSKANLEDLCTHFQQFLMVKTEDDRELYFRFYDPRVLRVFLPTCAAEETNQFFGPASCYLMESGQPDTLLKFKASPDGLKEEIVALGRLEEAGPENSP